MVWIRVHGVYLLHAWATSGNGASCDNFNSRGVLADTWLRLHSLLDCFSLSQAKFALLTLREVSG